MNKSEIVRLEREMFAEVSEGVIRPLNRILDREYGQGLGAAAGCLEEAKGDVAECLERVMEGYREKVQASDRLLRGLEVSSSAGL